MQKTLCSLPEARIGSLNNAVLSTKYRLEATAQYQWFLNILETHYPLIPLNLKIITSLPNPKFITKIPLLPPQWLPLISCVLMTRISSVFFIHSLLIDNRSMEKNSSSPFRILFPSTNKSFQTGTSTYSSSFPVTF